MEALEGELREVHRDLALHVEQGAALKVRFPTLKHYSETLQECGAALKVRFWEHCRPAAAQTPAAAMVSVACMTKGKSSCPVSQRGAQPQFCRPPVLS